MGKVKVQYLKQFGELVKNEIAVCVEDVFFEGIVTESGILTKFKETHPSTPDFCIQDLRVVEDKGFARVKSLAELACEVKLIDLHGCDLESVLFFLNWCEKLGVD